jgi:HSP20 family molecular chaperone IbpA
MSGAEPALLLGNGTIPAEGAIIGIRPEDLELTAADTKPAEGIALPLTVGAVERVGPESFVYGTLDRGDSIIVRLPGPHAPAPGERAVAVANRAKLHVFSADAAATVGETEAFGNGRPIAATVVGVRNQHNSCLEAQPQRPQVQPGTRHCADPRRRGASRASQSRLKEGFELMSRVPSLSSPFLLGFDEIERVLDRVTKAADGYPPYNIERLPRDERDPERLRITLAVAGFTREQLDVSIEESQLVIRGRQQEDKTREYLHRGIAARQFQRTFVLADGIEVMGADLKNGLLSIDLARPEPERVIKTIAIRNHE